MATYSATGTAAVRHHNISGETTTELFSAEDSIRAKSISIANTHATVSTYLDLYIGTISTKKNSVSTKYYLKKGYLLHKGETVRLNDFMPPGYGLYIKLTGVSTTSPTVDVIIP